MTQSTGPSSDWRPIYRSLRKQIDSGDLRPGDRLPTIAGLSAKMNVTPHAARRILESLREDGFVQSWQGHGYKVREPRIDIQLDAYPGWGKNTARAGRAGLARMTNSRVMRASRDMARDMSLKAGKLVYMAELVRSADRHAMAMSRSHFPMERFRGILDDVSATGSVTQALARHGVTECKRIRTRLEARMPTAHEALMIGIPRGQPVMVSTGINTDMNGDVVEVSMSVFRADSIAFEL